MSTQNETSPLPDDQKAGAFDDNSSGGEVTNGETGVNDITPEEVDMLNDAGIKESEDDDDEKLAGAQLDDADEDGDELNEKSDLTGADLDVPGSETDDGDEAIGEEDEENNSYSASDQEDEAESEL